MTSGSSATALARRVDHETGVAEDAGFFGPPGARLFGVAYSLFTLRTVGGSIHALRRISAQDAMIEMTDSWLDELDLDPVTTP